MASRSIHEAQLNRATVPRKSARLIERAQFVRGADTADLGDPAMRKGWGRTVANKAQHPGRGLSPALRLLR
jgi:hypothetical protein